MNYRQTFCYIAIVLGFYSTVAFAEEMTAGNNVPRIEDNSFLIEEAYNQESGVVQHITTWQYNEDERTWDLAFTQEWPVFSQDHQFSYTVPVSRVRDPKEETGFGDLLFNYRYQLINREGVAFSPRFSVIVPTGEKKDGLGSGSVGYQVNFPMSVDINEKWVSHWNLGFTVNPNEQDPFGNAASTTSFNYGASVIYLLHPNFHLMLEASGASAEEVGPGDSTAREDSFLLNPGFRFALNCPSGLQIVPGVSLPIGLGPSDGEFGVLAYLSLEHPF